MEKEKLDFEKSIFIGDLHIPYQDRVSVDLVLKFTQGFNPDYIFINGDLLDFYALSYYDKNPERLDGLQDELDQAHDFLHKIRSMNPTTKIKFLGGNHENRLQRYLWQHPEIASLRVLELENLLEFSKFNIDYHPYGEPVYFHDFLIEHGNKASKHSAFTAKSMLDDRQTSGLSNHVHRLGSHYKTDGIGKVKVWFENGCLCDLNPEYVYGVPNWQQGFSIGWFMKGENRFMIEQVPIIKHKIFYNGRIYK